MAAKKKAALANVEQTKKQLVQEFNGEEKVPMYLAPLYRPYFGNVMPVMISGVSIYFPVDGSTHMVPRSFAAEIERRRQAIDAILNKQGRMSNISANVESSPGELEFV